MTDLTSGSLSAALSLVALALVPLALMTLTSFAKIAVVLSALRNALGAPDLPSGAVVTAVALALSSYVMAPLASDIEQRLAGAAGKAEPTLSAALSVAREPLRAFLAKNAGKSEREMFVALSKERGQPARGDELPLLWASFALSELKQAFYLGFFVYLPFLVLDVVVANALFALGLVGLSAQNVALPFKLLLFVTVDGFVLVSRALVLSYK
jgi:flagellar biosynthesis protein FliP